LGGLPLVKIHIIAAALPPQIDGIGDYTAHMAAELTRSAEVTVLTGTAHPNLIPEACVHHVFSASQPRSVWNLLKPIEQEKPDWVLLQYNPFSYGRWGLNSHLPEVLHLIKGLGQTRIAVMAHETYTPIFNCQSALMSVWQRRQFQQLGQCADVLFFSMERSSRVCPSRFPQARRIHLPVGSNVPFVPVSKNQARAELNIAKEIVVLGLFGNLHISRMLGRVQEAAETVRRMGKKPLILYVGPDGNAFQNFLGNTPSITEGPLPGAEISRRLAAIDIYLAPFTDGISTRRGTVMAGLQHSLPTVGTMGDNTDSLLLSENGRSFLLAEAGSASQFSAHVRHLLEHPDQREELGRNGQQLFSSSFTWKHIAARLLSELE
jgi:glycosyltransferase involved in cell wall biosynthesis